MIYMLLFALATIICFILSHIMVEKRKLFAKNLLIGKVSEQKIRELIKIASNILFDQSLFFEGRYVNDSILDETYTIEIFVKKQEVEKVKIAIPKATVTVYNNNYVKIVHYAFSKLSATIIIFLLLYTLQFFIFSLAYYLFNL